jgi:glycosyltransferase involved in cell wall biosynthesis
VLNGKTVAVVVPCYNEARQIRMVVEAMPDFVDAIIAVDDASRDTTLEVLLSLQHAQYRAATVGARQGRYSYSSSIYATANNALLQLRSEQERELQSCPVHESDSSRLVVISHPQHRGVGAAMASGYRYARDAGFDCVARMDGDGQMDPAELASICAPIIEGRADYSKGNRLKHRCANQIIPRVRYYGNSVLSILTKIASGYWRVSDTQTGYTAISREALESIDVYNIYAWYGIPNDILVTLNIASFRITEVPIKPVYRIGEQTKMKIPKVLFSISLLLVRLFFKRLFKKYLLRDFHPLFLLYMATFVAAPLDMWVAVKWLREYLHGNIMYGWLIILVSLTLFTFQTFIFAMWFDMQDNERLYV